MNSDLAEFKKPINLVFLGIAVVSLAVTVVTYLWSRHESDISYHITTIQIVDQKEAVPFSVIDSDGQRVMGNVYAANVTVWNSGDLPIDTQNVRRPLTVSLTAPVRLVDAKLEYTTNANISEFRMEGDPKKSSTVQIGWRYFDPKEGFRLRLIYAAKDISTIKVDGVIFGVNIFNYATPTETFSFKQPGAIQEGIGVGIFLLLILVLIMLKGRVEEKSLHNTALMLLVLASLGLGFEMWGTHLASRPPAPPF